MFRRLGFESISLTHKIVHLWYVRQQLDAHPSLVTKRSTDPWQSSCPQVSTLGAFDPSSQPHARLFEMLEVMLADRQHLPQVQEWLMKEPPHEQLWHFTSPAGIAGIAEKAQVWATPAAWLNDLTEGHIAVDMAREYINRVVEQNQCVNDAEKGLLVGLLDQIARRDTRRDVYTVSFTVQRAFNPDVYGEVSPVGSTTADLLTQWQAYCPPDGGFALGVPGRHLRSVAGDQAFFLARCIYNRNYAFELVVEIVNWHRGVWRVTSPDDLEKRRSELVELFWDDIMEFAAVVKHWSFEHEQEWRLVGRVRTWDPRLRVRPTDTALVAHVPVNLVTAAIPRSPARITGTCWLCRSARGPTMTLATPASRHRRMLTPTTRCKRCLRANRN